MFYQGFRMQGGMCMGMMNVRLPCAHLPPARTIWGSFDLTRRAVSTTADQSGEL